MATAVTDLLGPTNDPEIRNAVWLAASGHCLACRVALLPSTGEPASLHVDHVVPRSRGGEDRLSNYQALCRDCNLRKGATYVDYRQLTSLVETVAAPCGCPAWNMCDLCMAQALADDAERQVNYDRMRQAGLERPSIARPEVQAEYLTKWHAARLADRQRADAAREAWARHQAGRAWAEHRARAVPAGSRR